jgi:hypothetical protein
MGDAVLRLHREAADGFKRSFEKVCHKGLTRDAG